MIDPEYAEATNPEGASSVNEVASEEPSIDQESHQPANGPLDDQEALPGDDEPRSIHAAPSEPEHPEPTPQASRGIRRFIIEATLRLQISLDFD